MTTITGLTADRMLAIEAASVVDGDVDASGNLILTQHGGTQINAGPVVGPPGPPGPVGSMLSVITAQPVLDVGVINQIRAGRQLSPADFGNMGLSAPLGLWNLSDLSDASGNGRALSNKGAVTFTSGINGNPNTAAQFTGNTAQALYIPDTGANDPFRIKVGSFGAWMKSAKTGIAQAVIGKYGPTGAVGSFLIFLRSDGLIEVDVSNGGTPLAVCTSITNVCDNRWHFICATYDSTIAYLYIDGLLDQVGNYNGILNPNATVALNVGGYNADGSTANSAPHYGSIDEAFVTSDVLSENQIRNLYCAKIGHTLAAVPARFTTNVRRRRRGAALAVADFPTQPLRLHNFSAGSLGDEGSNGAGLTNNGGAVSIAGVDGSNGNAFSFSAAQNLSSSDAALPAALSARSYGAWFKTLNSATGPAIFGWGAAASSGSGASLALGFNGTIVASNNADQIIGPYAIDGLWHHVVCVEDNGAIDGVKRKLYLDGKCVGTSTIMNAITLGGANRFRIGQFPDGSSQLSGQIDGVFVCDYALTPSQIVMLYAKSLIALSASPKNPGDHIEGADVNNLYAIFDALDSNAQVDLKVAS